MAGFAAAPLRCPTCGVANAAYATFCIECGEPLDEAAPRQRVLGRVAAPAAGSEAARPAVLALRRELWLGVVLIVGVLGFALLDWQHQEEQATGYRTGDTAAAAHHWDAAHAAFAHVGDYRDAVRRTADSATLISRRDTSYQAGSAALRADDPITAYRTLSETVAIEPDYRDAAALLDQAGRQIIQTALADTVYRRVSDGPPGLYARRADGTDWLLPGSDATSRVWTANTSGRVVYDGPSSPSLSAAPAAPPPDDEWDTRLPSGRQLWLAVIGETAPPKPLSRTFGLGGGMVVGQDGVWWYDPVVPDAEATHGYRVEGITVRLLVYYDLQALRATEAVLPEDTYFLLDSDPGAGRLLIGHYSWIEGALPTTQLYLAGPGGRTLQLLAQVGGVVNTAKFSPDGQYVLYSAATLTAVAADNHLELTAVNLANPQHPAEVLARAGAGGAGLNDESLRGTFVPGPGSPRVIIRRQAGTSMRLSVRNLRSDAEETLVDSAAVLPNFWLPADGQNLLYWDQQNRPTPALIIQPLDPHQPAMRLDPFAPVLSTRPTFVQVALTGDSVFYTVTGIPPAPDSEVVQRIPTAIYGASAKVTTSEAVLLCLQPFRPDGSARIVARGAVAACATADNNIRLRSPDGEMNLTTLDGVDALWPLHPTMWLWQP